MRVGLGVSEDLPIVVQQGLAVAIEQTGYASLWTNEASGRDAMLLCQAWAAATSDILVGVGVAPLWSRSPAQLATVATTLQEASGGRFLLGIGVGNIAAVAARHGVNARRPLTAVRELLTILDRLGRGEDPAFVGEVLRCDGVVLGVSPLPPPAPRYIAAMGPRMLALAGEAADGVLLNWSDAAEVGRAAGVVRHAAETAGRDPAEVDVATYVRVALGSSRDAARAALATQLARYGRQPSYAAHFERQGHGAALARAAQAQRAGADAGGLAEAIGDETLDALGWAGGPGDDPTPALRTYRDVGLDHLVVRVVVAGDDAVDAVTGVMRAVDLAALR